MGDAAVPGPAMTGRRMVFVEPGRPVTCETARVPAPSAGEVVLRTKIAGVCGTDAHRLGGDLPAPPMPVMFGHEGIGEIVALGAGVTSDAGGTPVRVGDLVYFSPAGLAKAGEPWAAPTARRSSWSMRMNASPSRRSIVRSRTWPPNLSPLVSRRATASPS